MARKKLITAFLNDNIRYQLDHMSETRKVIHAIGLVFSHAEECCDEQARLELAIPNGLALMQCAESMQADMDEIKQMILDAIEDEESSVTSEREKASRS